MCVRLHALAITDYTRATADDAAALLRACGLEMEHLSGGGGGGAAPNPFRRPLGTHVPCAALPLFSNGFVVLLRAAKDADDGAAAAA